MKALGFLWAWFKRNPLTKLAAVAVAFAAWYLASQVVYLTARHEVPVELRLAEEMVPVLISPSAVTLVVEAPPGLALKPEVRRDLSQTVTPGKVVFSLTPADVAVSPRARVLGIEPGQVEVILDRRIHRVLPVRVTFEGTPRPGYRVAVYQVDPPEVKVPGPENILKTMEEIETEPVSVAGRGGQYVFEQDVGLRPPSPSPPSELDRVRVRVEIAPALKTRTFDSIPVGILKPANHKEEISVTPREARVTVRGREDLVSALIASDIKIFVDVIGLTAGSYELPLHSRLPAGITAPELVPSSVRVSIGRIPAAGVE